MKATFCYSFTPESTEKGSVIPIFYSSPPRLGLGMQRHAALMQAGLNSNPAS